MGRIWRWDCGMEMVDVVPSIMVEVVTMSELGWSAAFGYRTDPSDDNQESAWGEKESGMATAGDGGIVRDRILPLRETVGAMKPLIWTALGRATRETAATAERARYKEKFSSALEALGGRQDSGGGRLGWFRGSIAYRNPGQLAEHFGWAGRGSIGYSGEMGELRVLGKIRESAGKTGARPPRLERFGLALYLSREAWCLRQHTTTRLSGGLRMVDVT